MIEYPNWAIRVPRIIAFKFLTAHLVRHTRYLVKIGFFDGAATIGAPCLATFLAYRDPELLSVPVAV